MQIQLPNNWSLFDQDEYTDERQSDESPGILWGKSVGTRYSFEKLVTTGVIF